MTGKISIIVPVYNAVSYLPQTIESLLSQTYKDIELILVDDGSTDDSLAVCKRYESDPRVVVIHQDNGGRSCARNTGLVRASGDFVGFMDDDDVAHPKMFESLYHALVSTDSDISMCQMIYGGEDEAFRKPRQERPVELIDRLEFYSRFFGPSYQTFGYRVVWNKLYRRTEDPELCFRSDVNGEDIDFLIRYKDKISKVAYIDTPLIYYRLHADSVSHSSTSIKKVLEDNIFYLKYFDFNDDITPLFIQKSWMEAFAVRHNSLGTDEEKDVRELYHTWRLESKKSGETATLRLWKRLAIKTMDYCPALYTLYLKLRQL